MDWLDEGAEGRDVDLSNFDPDGICLRKQRPWVSGGKGDELNNLSSTGARVNFPYTVSNMTSVHVQEKNS